MVVFSASATEYSDEDYLNFIETVDSCNATYGPGINTAFCIYRRDGEMMMGLLESMPDVSNNPGTTTEESENR